MQPAKRRHRGTSVFVVGGLSMVMLSLTSVIVIELFLRLVAGVGAVVIPFGDDSELLASLRGVVVAVSLFAIVLVGGASALRKLGFRRSRRTTLAAVSVGIVASFFFALVVEVCSWLITFAGFLSDEPDVRSLIASGATAIIVVTVISAAALGAALWSAFADEREGIHTRG